MLGLFQFVTRLSVDVVLSKLRSRPQSPHPLILHCASTSPSFSPRSLHSHVPAPNSSPVCPHLHRHPYSRFAQTPAPYTSSTRRPSVLPLSTMADLTAYS
ncbi:uncharacterized protein BP01DRAFT_135909 [Aspergillus saccharolyticus JOP 1030-1]|uniref:Uncharacterized protein n=1 Tax=Aspergillus saccharolyticus JOP 1030-1 TaxID=1450539 RepID=A0A318ZF58_9EURO|nr:hypothetical protein BP01DRAFT_135909 [Aspergillus saccharolyticus JOP 1030-1]PYH42240.1 hypothetical protein BP01DRAFT_135909 [Aspergillus saccharolyticus JOP 1030-1]